MEMLLLLVLLLPLLASPQAVLAVPGQAKEENTLRFISSVYMRNSASESERVRSSSDVVESFAMGWGNSRDRKTNNPKFVVPNNDAESWLGISGLQDSEYDIEKLITAVANGQKNSLVPQEKTQSSNVGKVEVFRKLKRLSQDAETKFGVGKLTCEICQAGVAIVQQLLSTNTSTEGIKTAAAKFCTFFKIESPRVCQGLVKEFAPEILTVFERLILGPSEVCGVVFGPECGNPYNPLDSWNVTFPSVPQPPPVYPTPPKKGSPTMRVLHLTDVHYDSRYTVGANADCGEPLCCRGGKPSPGEDGAWKYGDYRNCDSPLVTLESLFTTLAAQNDTFDYIIWTGDLPAHNVWNQSRAAQIDTLRAVVSMILKYFPGKPVYPSLGNHESSPVNSFPPPYIKGENAITWLYDVLADSWKNWLPQDALESVKKGAYYTVTPYPGMRIISLNMNYCNNENWWMLLNTTDPTEELQWLIPTLQQAENKKEKVHILGHIPPGTDDCLKAWSWNYYKIVSRYQNTIAGQFFGHTHMDSFEVFYDEETLKIPVGVAYIAPSVTPYAGLNMGYRFFTIDGNYPNSSFQVLDHETFYLNLTKANLEDKITWEFEYSAKAAYSMSSVYPKDWDDLITRMKTNSTLLNTYNKFLTKSRNTEPCDADCRKLLLCAAKSGRSHDPSLCKDLGITSDRQWADLLRKQPKHC